MPGIDVIVEDPSDHPRCPHGPTLLFSRDVNGKPKRFYACSACRDRKDCPFFLWADELEQFNRTKRDFWATLSSEHTANVDHPSLVRVFGQTRNLPADERFYCRTCSSFQLGKHRRRHEEHDCVAGVSDHQLAHPSELLLPLENDKKEAQYLFGKSSVKLIVDSLRSCKLMNVICIGAPRIHEYILSQCNDMSSILLDIDDRYHQFFSPLQFCWYNSFNNHFFLEGAADIFSEYLKQPNLVVVMDPPFGGRVEPLAQTVKTISEAHKKFNEEKDDLPVLWTFPYFMEPQIVNSLPTFRMLDYKVDYDNHPLFTSDTKGRKYGSPVRIFTNIDPSLIELPASEGYKYCKQCLRWTSEENRHCSKCNECTSKDGRTYLHCDICSRCVKPTWKHCEECGRCAQPDHKCGVLIFDRECFHCKQHGHKKRDCPKVDRVELKRKRNEERTTKVKKRRKGSNAKSN